MFFRSQIFCDFIQTRSVRLQPAQHAWFRQKFIEDQHQRKVMVIVQWKNFSTGLLAAWLLIFSGCGNQTADIPASSVTQADSSQPMKEDASKETKDEQDKKTIRYVTASDALDNLQLTAAEIPVYDSHTLAERRAKGLPIMLPELHPYQEKRMAYLTFDDGPDDMNTPAILDILQQEQVKATFYVLGRAVQAYPETLKRMFEEGHAIGNHSYDHDYGKLYASVDNYLAEMEETDEILHELLGVRPFITRAPGGRFGHFDSAYEAAGKENGYVEHDWNVSSADTAPNHPIAQDFMDNIEEQANMESAIILMHCSGGHEETVKALPGIIRILKEKGYDFGVVTPMTPQPW